MRPFVVTVLMWHHSCLDDCCPTTFEAALLPSVRERQLCFLAAAFKIPKSGKQPKVSFYSLFSKQSPKPNSQLFLYLAGPLSGFNLFGLSGSKTGRSISGLRGYTCEGWFTYFFLVIPPSLNAKRLWDFSPGKSILSCPFFPPLGIRLGLDFFFGSIVKY